MHLTILPCFQLSPLLLILTLTSCHQHRNSRLTTGTLAMKYIHFSSIVSFVVVFHSCLWLWWLTSKEGEEDCLSVCLLWLSLQGERDNATECIVSAMFTQLDNYNRRGHQRGGNKAYAADLDTSCSLQDSVKLCVVSVLCRCLCLHYGGIIMVCPK